MSKMDDGSNIDGFKTNKQKSQEKMALIRAVKQRPALWDYTHELNAEKKLKEELWKEIACKMKLPVEEVKLKWKTVCEDHKDELMLMDLAVAEGKRRPKPSKYFRSMYFLKKNLWSDSNFLPIDYSDEESVINGDEGIDIQCHEDSSPEDFSEEAPGDGETLAIEENGVDVSSDQLQTIDVRNSEVCIPEDSGVEGSPVQGHSTNVGNDELCSGDGRVHISGSEGVQFTNVGNDELCSGDGRVHISESEGVQFTNVGNDELCSGDGRVHISESEGVQFTNVGNDELCSGDGRVHISESEGVQFTNVGNDELCSGDGRVHISESEGVQFTNVGNDELCSGDGRVHISESEGVQFTNGSSNEVSTAEDNNREVNTSDDSTVEKLNYEVRIGEESNANVCNEFSNNISDDNTVEELNFEIRNGEDNNAEFLSNCGNNEVSNGTICTVKKKVNWNVPPELDNKLIPGNVESDSEDELPSHDSDSSDDSFLLGSDSSLSWASGHSITSDDETQLNTERLQNEWVPTRLESRPDEPLPISELLQIDADKGLLAGLLPLLELVPIAEKDDAHQKMLELLQKYSVPKKKCKITQ